VVAVAAEEATTCPAENPAGGFLINLSGLLGVTDINLDIGDLA
jgi:hypothetical protein